MAKKTKSKKKKQSSVQVFLKKMNIQKEEVHPSDTPILSKYSRLMGTGSVIQDLFYSSFHGMDEDVPDQDKMNLQKNPNASQADHPDQNLTQDFEEETSGDLFDYLRNTGDPEILELLKEDDDEFDEAETEDAVDDEFEEDDYEDDFDHDYYEEEFKQMRLYDAVDTFMETSVNLSRELYEVNGEKIRTILLPYLEWMSRHKQQLNGKILCIGEYGFLSAFYLAANHPFSKIFWKGEDEASEAVQLGLEELLFVQLPSVMHGVENLNYLIAGSEEKEGPYDVILMESQQQPWFAPRLDDKGLVGRFLDTLLQQITERTMDKELNETEKEQLEELTQIMKEKITDIEKTNNDHDITKEQRESRAKVMAERARRLLNPDGLLVNIEYAPTSQALDDWADEFSKNGLEALDIEKNQPVESTEYPGYMSIHTYRAPALADAKETTEIQSLPSVGTNPENPDEQNMSMVELVTMVGSLLEVY